MDDLKVAKQRLKAEKSSLVFVKDHEVIFETNIDGLAGFLQAIEKLKSSLDGASVADRIIGKAAALLCVYVKVKAAFAVILSKSGLGTLNAHTINCEFENLVPTILNMTKTDQCPFEKLVAKIANPQEAYRKIRQFSFS